MSPAETVLEEIRAELAHIRDQLLTHPYLAAVEGGLVDLTQLRAFAGEQHAIITSDLRSVACLVSRFGDELFLDVLSGERASLAALFPFAAALGMGRQDLEDYEPLPGAHAYTAYIAWMASHASAAEVATAYVINFGTWGESCGRLSRALRGRYHLPREALRLLDQFATPADDFEERACAIVTAGLERGVPRRLLHRSARLLQSYELLYWDTLLGEPQR